MTKRNGSSKGSLVTRDKWIVLLHAPVMIIVIISLDSVMWGSSMQWFGIGLWSKRSWFDSRMVLFVVVVSLSKNFTHIAAVDPAGNVRQLHSTTSCLSLSKKLPSFPHSAPAYPAVMGIPGSTATSCLSLSKKLPSKCSGLPSCNGYTWQYCYALSFIEQETSLTVLRPTQL